MLKTSGRLPSLARKTASTRKLPLASIRGGGGFLQVKMEQPLVLPSWSAAAVDTKTSPCDLEPFETPPRTQT